MTIIKHSCEYCGDTPLGNPMSHYSQVWKMDGSPEYLRVLKQLNDEILEVCASSDDENFVVSQTEAKNGTVHEWARDVTEAGRFEATSGCLVLGKGLVSHTKEEALRVLERLDEANKAGWRLEPKSSTPAQARWYRSKSLTRQSRYELLRSRFS